MFAIKAEVSQPNAALFTFSEQKTMYGGKLIAKGDLIFVFASKNEGEGKTECEGAQGLIARGIVVSAEVVPKKTGVARQTPRVSIKVKRTALSKRQLEPSDIKPFCDWEDGRPLTEINFKFYRQATNKIVGLSAETSAFLQGYF